MPAPPTTRAMRTGLSCTSGRSWSRIWPASSRVGARIRLRTVFGAGLPGAAISPATSGRPKASVLPVPVWARPITSWPLRACGMAWLWIGVGSEMPMRSSLRVSDWGRPISSKSVKSCPFAGAHRDAAARSSWFGPPDGHGAGCPLPPDRSLAPRVILGTVRDILSKAPGRAAMLLTRQKMSVASYMTGAGGKVKRAVVPAGRAGGGRRRTGRGGR